MNITVGIDAQIHPNSGAGGVATLIIGLIHALGRLTDGEERYLIVAPTGASEWLDRYTGPNQRIVSRATPGLVARLRRRIRRWRNTAEMISASDGFYEALGCDVVHFPYPSFVRTTCPMVYNPHDLQHLHLPRFFSPEMIAWRESLYRAGCERAETVVVASDWIKRDIAVKYGVSPDRLQVIPAAPPTEAYEEPSGEGMREVRRQLDLPAHFGFYPAMTWPHKNHLRLLESLALLRDERGIEVHLVCTGKKNDFWPEIEKRIVALDLREQVRFLGMVPPETLRCIYGLATFAILPTCFEAASGPLFESWQAGLPAAVSAVTSLPEQARDAALLFDPYDTESMADAVAQLHADSNLRASLRERGRARLADFSWERTAKAYRAVYRRAAGRALSEEEKRLLKWDWMRDQAQTSVGEP